MKRTGLCVLLILNLLWMAGCEKPATTPPPPSGVPPIPTQAQPKLQTINLLMGTNVMKTELALNQIQMQTGMMFRTNMEEMEGMLFVFPQPHRASFWMKNTLIPLSAAYIDPDGIIQEIHDLTPGDTNSVTAASDNIQYVLETKQGWFKRHNVGVGTAVASEQGPFSQIFTFQKR